MKRLIKTMRTLLLRPRQVGGDTKRLPSLVKAMKVLVPRSVMREVVSSSPDRRQWGVLAAAWVGVSEREFIHAAAQELRMPYQDHVAVPDLTIFATEARSMLSALRKIGAVVVLEGSEIVGFVAADPAEVRGLECYDGTQNISMAPWTEIAKALDMAERLIAEVEANIDRSEAVRRKELSDRVVGLLVFEALQHGASSLEILASEGTNRYQFTASDGKIAVGAIHPEALQGVLTHLITLDGDSFTHQSVGAVLVRSLGSSKHVKLSWSMAKYPVALEWQQDEAQQHGMPEQTSMHSFNPSVAVSSSQEQGVAPGVPVLVIDDNPMFRGVLERLLKRDNFDVSFAENGLEALERLSSLVTLTPRVILCDLHMPKMNGKEFVVRLKEDLRLRTIPVIMLTSDDGIDAELSMLELGVDALVSKSKDPRILCAHVIRLAKATRLQEAA